MNKTIVCLLLAALLAFGGIGFGMAEEESQETWQLQLGEEGTATISLPAGWIHMPLDETMQESGILLMATNEDTTVILQISRKENSDETLESIQEMLKELDEVSELGQTELASAVALSYRIQNTLCYIMISDNATMTSFNFMCFDESKLDAEQFLKIVESFTETPEE